MIDLILIFVLLVVFYVGFRAGNTYKTLGEMFKDLLNKLPF